MSELEIPGGAILPVFPGRLTLTGMTISAPLPFEQWEEIVQRLMVMNECSGWWLGDALLYGEGAFGENYAQAVEVTGKRYQTLVNYVFVCRHIPQEERRDDLSFSHHAEVAGVRNPSERAKWLEKASQEEWSISAFRKARQEAREAVPGELPPSPAEVQSAEKLPVSISTESAAADSERREFEVKPFEDMTDEEIANAVRAMRNINTGDAVIGPTYEILKETICDLLAACEQARAHLLRYSDTTDVAYLDTVIAKVKGEVTP